MDEKVIINKLSSMGYSPKEMDPGTAAIYLAQQLCYHFPPEVEAESNKDIGLEIAAHIGRMARRINPVVKE